MSLPPGKLKLLQPIGARAKLPALKRIFLLEELKTLLSYIMGHISQKMLTMELFFQSFFKTKKLSSPGKSWTLFMRITSQWQLAALLSHHLLCIRKTYLVVLFVKILNIMNFLILSYWFRLFLPPKRFLKYVFFQAKIILNNKLLVRKQTLQK